MTSTMSRLVLTSALALGALAVIGGFTPGAATADAEPSVSPFAGSWSGTWAVAELGADGTWDLTISDAGRLTGRVDITGADGGAIVGHVGADGNLMLIGFAPADDPLLGNGAAFQGTAAIDGDGRLVASATRTDSGRTLVAVLERN
jgi:hypothetical protein